MTATVVVEPDAGSLATAVAGRLLGRLADAQDARGRASLVLTGGGIGIAVLRAVRAAAPHARVAWDRVDLWWGDERYVPAADPQRNDLQAHEALLDDLGLTRAQVHPMPAADGPFGADVDRAAADYAEQLRAAAPTGALVPEFDVLLLGMGPEGHTASIFPDSPAAVDARPCFAVRDCPKPPPTRVSLGFTAINSAREVWVVVTGAAKAPALRQALAGAARTDLPVAGVGGREQTLWLLDASAASALEPG